MKKKIAIVTGAGGIIGQSIVNNLLLLKIDKLPIGNEIEKSRYSSFALDNKIVDNGKLKKILDYKFIFPSYKEGLKQIVKNSI